MRAGPNSALSPQLPGWRQCWTCVVSPAHLSRVQKRREAQKGSKWLVMIKIHGPWLNRIQRQSDIVSARPRNTSSLEPVMRIRDVYPGSSFSIPHPGSRAKKAPVLGFGSARDFFAFLSFNQKKLLVISRRNDPRCLSPILYFSSQIPDPDLLNCLK